MKKFILEDIENMKYLLGYKRGIVISEQAPVVNQDEDNALNPNIVDKSEQPAATTQPATTTQPTATTGPIKMGVKNPRVQVLQQLLNDKFQAGLVADGLYGPKTADAIYKNIVAINKLNLNPTNTLKPAEIPQKTASPAITAPLPPIK